MVQRVLLTSNPPRLITSKAGKNATVSMSDDDKTFDSNWFDGGGIKWILQVPKPDAAVSFPYPLNYIPYVWGFSGGQLWNGDNNKFYDGFFAPADKPPVNDCILTSASVQLPQNIPTISTTGIGNPKTSQYDSFVDYWIVFEG